MGCCWNELLGVNKAKERYKEEQGIKVRNGEGMVMGARKGARQRGWEVKGGCQGLLGITEGL